MEKVCRKRNDAIQFLFSFSVYVRRPLITQLVEVKIPAMLIVPNT